MNKSGYRPVITAAVVSALIITLAYIFYFGFRVKDWDNENRLQWSAAGGLEFTEPSMAFSEDDVFGLGNQKIEYYERLIINLELKPVFSGEKKFGFIVQLYNGKSSERLLIGQWENTIVIMNGDDYGNYRREPKIYLPLQPKNGFYEIKIDSGLEGTEVYVDGKLERENESLQLRLPQDLQKTRLIAGCSEIGRNNWEGIIKRFNLYIGDFEPLLYYDFSSADGTAVYEKTVTGKELLIPERRVIVKKDFLSWPRAEMFARYDTVVDIILNLAGFIPLGIFIYLSAVMLIGKSGTGLSDKALFIVTICIGLVLSLFIELYQAWLPSRSSSLLDLILNTAGCAAGAVIARRIRPFLPPDQYSE